MTERAKNPRDVNQLAKFTLGVATGRVADEALDTGKDNAASELGRLGGMKDGKARARAFSTEERSAITVKAARA